MVQILLIVYRLKMGDKLFQNSIEVLKEYFLLTIENLIVLEEHLCLLCHVVLLSLVPHAKFPIACIEVFKFLLFVIIKA